MGSNNAPRIKWFLTKWDGGPVKVRRRLCVNGRETPYFVDTDRYGAGENTLFGSGMDKSGCAAFLASGKVSELKSRAERLATS
jgi:hypothetical protein